MEEKTLGTSKKGFITKTVCLIIILIGVVAFTVIYSVITNNVAADYMDSAKKSAFLYFAPATILPSLVISLLVFLGTARCNITVTDKRVYGKSTFGKRVDIPLDKISAVGTGILKQITVASSSGKIKFFDISNRDELHTIINNLLIERQSKKETAPITTIKQEVPQSNADELKKFKELLDSGIITQEEFDAKKKQLLGL